MRSGHIQRKNYFALHLRGKLPVGPPKYNARVFDSCQNAEKMFVKMLIMNNFRKFCKHLDIKSVLYRIVLYQTNKINRR